MQNETIHANHSMKTHIMFRRAFTALTFAAILALPPRPAQAQTNVAPQGKKEEANAPSIRGIQYDLEIVGGVIRTHPDHPNIGGGASLKPFSPLARSSPENQHRHSAGNFA